MEQIYWLLVRIFEEDANTSFEFAPTYLGKLKWSAMNLCKVTQEEIYESFASNEKTLARACIYCSWAIMVMTFWTLMN